MPTFKRLHRIPFAMHRFGRVFSRTWYHSRAVLGAHKRFGSPLPLSVVNPIMMAWARDMLLGLGAELKSIGTPSQDPAILVGNHISYIDIPLILAARPAQFLAKKELRRWPILGAAADLVQTVWVERESGESRRNAAAVIAPALQQYGRSVVLFPSGTTSIDEKKPWRHGAFKVAKENRLPVQPFRIRYKPLRRAAFIDQDWFLPHLLHLLMADGMEASVEFAPVRFIENVEKDCEEIRRWTMEGL